MSKSLEHPDHVSSVEHCFILYSTLHLVIYRYLQWCERFVDIRLWHRLTSSFEEFFKLSFESRSSKFYYLAYHYRVPWLEDGLQAFYLSIKYFNYPTSPSSRWYSNLTLRSTYMRRMMSLGTPTSASVHNIRFVQVFPL